jgi:hypothetical protein
MMIKSTNIGIVELEEKLNNYQNVDKKSRALAKELLRMEKRNIDALKKYL